ncbi:MAG: hypothetical protein ACOZF0_14870 [Thermodesulfobacteriota bacterium]
MNTDNGGNLQKTLPGRWLFAAGDVGGARALLPVIRECANQGIPFGVLAHGQIASETDTEWTMIDPPEKSDTPRMSVLLDNLKAGAFVFASSVHDTFALTMARQAAAKHIPLVHVLDNWTAYRHRLENDGLPLLHPDVYTAMDSLAFEEAVAEGIDPAILKITGHPALADLGRQLEQQSDKKPPASSRRQIVFVSEPVAADQSGDSSSPFFRGYTESQVLDSFCRALQPHAGEVTVSILPHPRENPGRLHRTWEEAKGLLEGKLTDGTDGRGHVLRSDGVAGMASLLLYEAWLAGKPVISIQPDLRRHDLRMLSRRKEIHFADTDSKINATVNNWLSDIRKPVKRRPHPDLVQHRESAAKICSLLKDMTATMPGAEREKTDQGRLT